jgi:YedE family putative selenium metabolism protein
MSGKYWTARTWITLGGLLFGVLATLLTRWGNPPNMGVCIACFYRDIAGALGLHRTEVVQYLRPEIMGLVLGAFIASYIFREFKPRGGSSPIVRFFLGVFMMIGALVFLGCPTRALVRLAGGDLNGLPALLGLIVGAFLGILFLKGGYSLGRSGSVAILTSWMMPIFMLFLLLLVILQPQFILSSEKGPGSMRAALWLSLMVGVVIGVIAQKTRMCFIGAWRDVMLVGDTYLISGIAAFFVGVLVCNYVLGNFSSGLYHWGFRDQPIAHANHLWNFLGMMLVGLCALLLGGCPMRQTILSGEGDVDAGVTVLGCLVGTALCHNFLLASSPKGLGKFGPAAVVVGLVFCIAIGLFLRERA